MTLIGNDPYITTDTARAAGIELVALAELLARADVVSLHMPLTDATRGLIGHAELARMKPTAFLINAARGGLVDEQALAEALTAGALAGAAVDVFASEPPAADSPLRQAPNTVLTPHLGASTREAQTRAGVQTAKAVLEVLASRRVGQPVAG
jgi:D-3-phosphoglycerate dehydrogenase